MKLIICGAGQYGLAAREIAEEMKQFSLIEFLDDASELAVGALSDIDKIEYDKAFVAIGNSEVRSKLLAQIPSHKIATLLHPKATVMPSAVIGEGSIIEAGAVICSHAEIGQGCIVMANAVVGHDAKIGRCCQLKYNCTVPERCVVPDRTKVDCNVMYHDKKAIDEMNRCFVEEEIKKNGVEPGYF